MDYTDLKIIETMHRPEFLGDVRRNGGHHPQVNVDGLVPFLRTGGAIFTRLDRKSVV